MAIGRLSQEAQNSLLRFCIVVLDIHNKQSEFRTKLEAIDVAYARYKQAEACEEGSGVDTPAGNTPCGVDAQDITNPIVVSQVDSYFSYLNDVYLSGYPIFPVIGTPSTLLQTEQLQAIIDDHATRGRYQRQLSLSFKGDIKYNVSAIEVDWCALDLYSIASNISEPTKDPKVDKSIYYINKLKALDMYNVIMDGRVAPVDIPMSGEYAGYIEIISRIELKRRLAYYAESGYGYFTAQAMRSSLGRPTSGPSPIYGYYKEKPQISDYLNKNAIRNAQIMDWPSYLANSGSTNKTDRLSSMSDIYEHTTLYARIVPDEHGIDAPKRGTPQIWKLCFVNHEKLVYAQRIFTIYDCLPIFFAQPHEDFFDYQTKSVAENAIPFQDATSKLLAIRLHAARRALVDRAIYDQAVLSPNDVNSPHASAKIPMKANSMLGTKTIEQIYHAIPFDSRGTETVLQDMSLLSQMADDMNGVNKPQRGQFQKGNKSRKEWDDTMAGSYGRMRNCALLIEYQQMLPIKEQIKLNIFHKGVAGQYQNRTSGEVYEITAKELEELRKTVNNFQLADGLLPADKIASTEFIIQGMNMISTSQPLQLALGSMLPQMFMYLMNVGGVKNLEQFMPQTPATGGKPPQGGQGGAA